MGTEYRGIDYGMGQTNVDKETGIRYGVINQNEVLQAWADSSEPYCDCDECKQSWDIEQDDDTGKFFTVGLDSNHGPFDTEEELREYIEEQEELVFGCDCCEPTSSYVDDKEYQAECGESGDIFISKSPYYTFAQFCSPCAPGACYLMNPCTDGEKAYCFGHDWFDGERTPYPVYCIADNKQV